MAKGHQVRVQEETLKLVRMYAGELQMDTGDNISDNDAIFELFKLYRADLIKKLRERPLNNKGKNGKSA